LNYCAHTERETVGLYPDGGTAVYVLGNPTIAANNLIGSYDSLYSEHGTESGIQPIFATNGSMTVVYEDGYVCVKGEQNMSAQLEIYTAVGQQVYATSLNLQAGEVSTYVGNLPSGVYVATVTGANGVTGSCKFIVK
jgi:hypothetical protein